MSSVLDFHAFFFVLLRSFFLADSGRVSTRIQVLVSTFVFALMSERAILSTRDCQCFVLLALLCRECVCMLTSLVNLWCVRYGRS
jgi:hypothetical protein